MESEADPASPVAPSDQTPAPAPEQPQAKPRPRWRRRLVGAAINLAIVLGLFVAIECYLRYLHTPSVGFTRFIFLQEMSSERWDYLEDHRDESLLEDVRKERAPQRRANYRYTEDPEMDRPPYDRVQSSYEVVTNNLGFRDGPFRAEKPAGVRRVLLLGDSLTFGKGMPVEHRFSDLLRARAPRRVELLNAGDLGCSVECELEVLKQLLPHSPDLVILQPSGNDMDQSMWRIAMESPKAAVPRFRWAYRSRIIQALAYRIYGDTQSGQVDTALESASRFYDKTLTAFFGLCRARGIRVLVMSFPAANGVWYGAHVSDACRAHPKVCLGVIRADFEHPERWLPTGTDISEITSPPSWIVETAALMDLDATVLMQLFPHLRFFADLIHPNRLTHRIAAAQLEDFLASQWSGWQR